VRVHRGPLAGVEGILLQVKSSYRLVVSLTLLGRSVASEIDSAFVKPL
jgi:transcription antitermination factor NusG